MKNQFAIFFAIVVFVISTAILASIITGYSPYQADVRLLTLFFIALAGFIATTFGAIWHNLKQAFLPKSIKISFWNSFRQTIIFGCLVSLITFFKALSIIDYWNTIPLIIACLLLELYFQSEKTLKNHPTN